MVKNKHQKPKQKNQHPRVKKQSKLTDISEFHAQLDALGLKIVQVIADGNCFFRAVADQLDGNEEEHEKYRKMVVQYIRDHREMFEPFIDDGAPFDEYCQSMEKDGTWAGHMELQAASLVTHTNLCIHQKMAPRWYMQNFDNQRARMIHLSYHDGEHYNSVRAKEDACDGPAKPISLKADVNLTASSQAAKSEYSPSISETSKNALHSGALNRVLAASGCNDVDKVEQVLLLVDGDIDAAVEFLIAEREFGETITENGSSEYEDKGNDRSGTSSKLEKSDPAKRDHLVDSKRLIDVKSSSNPDKVPRNKVCPCGSKKKYKSCCGTASARTRSKPAVVAARDHEGFITVAKKGQRGKQRKKDAPVTNVPFTNSDGLLDMGALCI